MKRTIIKVISFALSAALLCSSLTAVCADRAYAYDIPDITYHHYDITVIDDLLSDFSDACSIPDNDSEVKSLYNQIIHAFDDLYTQNSIAQINYNSNPSDDYYKTEYLYMSDTLRKTPYKIFDVLSQEINNSEYTILLSDFLGKYSDAVKRFKMPEIPDSNKQAELCDEFYSINASGLSENEKETKIAQLYLDLANYLNSQSSTGNYLNDAYMVYDRDYSIESISKLNSCIKDSSKKAFKFCQKKLSETNPPQTVTKIDDPFIIINDYTENISAELKESSEYILKNKLYTLADSTVSAGGAFTINLPLYNTAYIFQSADHSFWDVQTSVHEFGHFNSMRHDNIPALLSFSQNLDICEVQSQGLEILFSKFYDQIFDDLATRARLVNVYNMVSIISGGFMINEFENYIFSNASHMTAQDVIDTYDRIQKDYDVYNVDFYVIPHLFECPGYYISYAVSALGASNILKTATEDGYSQAVDMYTKVSHINTTNCDYSFSDGLQQCGFDNVLSEDYISDLEVPLNDYVNIQCGIIPGDINSDGTLSASDIKLIKNMLLYPGKIYPDNQLVMADVNYDSSVNATDMLAAAKKLLK